MNQLVKTMGVIIALGCLPLGRAAVAADITALLPFVDQQTAVVLRMDTGQLSDQIRAQVARASGFLPATMRNQLRRIVEHPEIGEFFAVVSLADAPTEMPFVVFKRPADWTDTKSMELIEQTDLQSAAIGEAIVVGWPKVVERLKANEKSAGKQAALREAFDESGGASAAGGLQLAVVLNDDQRKVIGELWQPLLDRHLPLDANLVANIKWAIVSATGASNDAIELHVQTTGKPLAAELFQDIHKDLPIENSPLRRLPSPPDRLKTETKLSGGWLTSTLDNWTKATTLQTARKNFSKIGLAMHNYHSAYRQLPSAASKDPNGKPLLSWRVQILAFLGPKEQQLFRKFKMDQPWDSPHNRELIKEMPDAFRVDLTSEPDGRSTIAIPLGPEMAFHNDAPKFKDIVDGLSNTIVAVEVPEDQAEVWTKPNTGVVIDPEDPAAGIGGHFGDKVLVLWGDGSVRMVDVSKHRASLHAMFTRHGKEPFKHPSTDEP